VSKNYLNNYLVALVLFWAFSASSCHILKRQSRRNVVLVDSTANIPPIPPVSDSVLTYTKPVLDSATSSLVNLCQSLSARRFSFSTFSGKARVHYEGGGDEQDFTAHIRMQRDSLTWISVTALGSVVQVARMIITPDSVRLIDYLKNQYSAIPVADIGRMLPIPPSYDMVQSVLLGQVPLQEGEAVSATGAGGTYALSVVGSTYKTNLKWNRQDTTLRSQELVIPPDLQSVFQYGDYKQKGSFLFAQSRIINLIVGNAQHYADLNFLSAEFDKPVEFPFTIPKNFTRK
jgi:hypothetical protein